MGLPGHRRTSSHKRRRASHFALKPLIFTVCSHCKQSVLPHKVCVNCGYYRGRQVLKLKSRLVGRARARAAAVEAKNQEDKDNKEQE